MFPFAVAAPNLGVAEIVILVLVLALISGIAWAVARSVSGKKEE